MMTDVDEGEGDDDGAPANSNQEEGEDHEEPALAYWLMKSEPESRVEKGVDVKFSIEDLENAKGAVVWDGMYSTLLLPLFFYFISIFCVF